jgi:hypothetical protein
LSCGVAQRVDITSARTPPACHIPAKPYIKIHRGCGRTHPRPCRNWP